MPWPASTVSPALTTISPVVTTNAFSATHHRSTGTALFYWALGILPFKDGFYSSTHPQVGGQTVGPETDPDREILMATLSGAMVGAMDGLGLLNATRVMASCRKDGVVLKPDVPVTTVDWCWRHADPSCLLYSTYSDVTGLGRTHYFFSNELIAFNASLLPSGFPAASAVWHDWYSGSFGAFVDLDEAYQPGVGYEGHMYGARMIACMPSALTFAHVGRRSLLTA